MSFQDPAADAVQPDSGQGGQGTEAPYAEYLNRIPEEVREQVEPVFRDWDSNTTRRFQDAADYRRQWEPYEQLGVNQLSPEDVEWALQFRQTAINNPQAVQEWFEGFALANGLTTQQAAEVVQQAEESYDYGDPTPQFEQMLKSQLGPMQSQLEQMSAWREQQEEQTRYAEARQFVDHQIEELKAAHPDEFSDPERAHKVLGVMEGFVKRYEESDPRNAVTRGFADYQSLKAQIEHETLQGKQSRPSTAESGGGVSGAVEPVKTLAEAHRLAREQIRQMNQQ